MLTNERYRFLASRFTDVIDAVPDDQWHALTPCEGWSALDVVQHVVSTEYDFLGRMGFSDSPRIVIADARAAWPAVRDAMQAALDRPDQANHAFDGYFGPTTFAGTAASFYCADLTVHRWDIARAVGLASFEEVPATEIDLIMDAFGPDSSLAKDMRQPGLFNDPVAVSNNADDTTKLMAWLGRTVTPA